MNQYKLNLLAVSAAALMITGAAVPAAAQADGPAAAGRVDLGPAPAGAVLKAVVHVAAGRDKDQAFAAALSARYDRNSPSFHKWMTDEDLAAFAPAAEDVNAVLRALSGYGLKVTAVRDGGAALDVSGAAQAMQRAFSARMRLVSVNGRRTFATATSVEPQGALARRVEAVTGLDGGVFQPFLRHQHDADGQRVGGVATDASSPLDSFSNQCFTDKATVHLTDGSRTIDVQPSWGYAIDGKICGYTPAQVIKHYGLTKLAAAGADGTGQTIVIVDAYGSPTAKKDANTFFAAVGVSPFTNDNFKIVYPAGKPVTTDYGWAGETALDIEWAHAIAPGAKIILVVAPDNNNTSFEAALSYVVSKRLGNVVSNSYGLPEAATDAATRTAYNKIGQQAAAKGISLMFSTGDSGDNGSPSAPAGFPASAASVTAVGGTSLDVPAKIGAAETGWGNWRAQLSAPGVVYVPPSQQGFFGGAGGGASAYFAKPTWQANLPGDKRQTPDVSAIADPYTGAIIVEPVQGSASVFTSIGGTSLASPVFAAVWAIADQLAGYDEGTGAYTPGSSLGLAAALAPDMAASGALSDVGAVKPKTQLAATLTDGTTSSVKTGYQILGIPADRASLTALRLRSDGGYSVLSFDTDSSLTTNAGWDTISGYGVPEGSKLKAFAQAAAGH